MFMISYRRKGFSEIGGYWCKLVLVNKRIGLQLYVNFFNLVELFLPSRFLVLSFFPYQGKSRQGKGFVGYHFTPLSIDISPNEGRMLEFSSSTKFNGLQNLYVKKAPSNSTKLLLKYITILFIFLTTNLNAQYLGDTVHINEVVISSQNLSKFQTGAKIEKIDVQQVELLQDGNLEQLLNRVTPMSFKGMAGGLSTIRVRGTSPDHTSINFGGININSLTLGHSNVSNVPMYLFDKVGLQYGSSSAVNGSGSIGGAIHLGLNSNWVKGFKGEIRTAFGTLGEQLYGTKLFAGNGKWELATRAYYYNNKNRFKYYNEDYADFETGQRGKVFTQRNADIENKGLIQEFNYKFAQNEMAKLMVWVEDDWHLVQQNMAINEDTSKLDTKEPLLNQSVRVWAAYNNRKNPLMYHVGSGYVFDHQNHNNSPNNIQTKRFVNDLYVEYDITRYASIKTGVKSQSIKPNVYAYADNINIERRVDAYLQCRFALNLRFQSTVNIRKGYVTDYKVPFTPAIGFSYLAFKNDISLVKLTANVSRNYKVPTFNDRFWGELGNPDLKPENGYNIEFGSKYSICMNDTYGNLALNLFYMDVDDWILWQQKDDDWYPENVLNVISKGIELTSDVNYSISKVILNSGLVYAYTSTVRSKSEGKSPAIGRQMEYVPLHSFKVFNTATVRDWKIGFDGQGMPWQYTNEEVIDIIDGYFLLNFNFGKSFLINQNHKINIRALLNNVLNVNYQSSYGYAMPRFNAKLSITYNFN